MPQSTQALRTRIKSVKSTRKITKAMEMIANAKLVRQRAKMEANREYAQRLQDTVDEIAAKNPEIENRFIHNNAGSRAWTVVFCSDLGLCGGYNQNIVRLARENLNREDPIFLVGTSLMRQLKEEGFNIVNEEPESSDRINFMRLKEIIEYGTDQYLSGAVDKVQILYTRFVNTMSFQPELDVLLPCDLNYTAKEEVPADDLHVETLFEPNAETILDKLIPMMIQDVAYADWMESTTAEQGSRRVAMKTATDNADELSADLMLEYNKVRQASITQEITEIVGGSAAV